VVAFGSVGDGFGADRSAPPEGSFAALGFEHRMIRRFDRNAVDVLAIDLTIARHADKECASIGSVGDRPRQKR